MTQDPRRAAYHHAAGRLVEWYALHLTVHQFLAPCDTVEGQAQTLAHADHGRTVISLRVHGVPTRAIYCPKTRCLITFLLPEYRATTTAHRCKLARRQRIEGFRQPSHPPYKRRRKHGGTE